METPPSSTDRFRFDEFEVDVCLRQLRKGGHRIRLQEQPFQVLLALLERQGELVTREELRAQIWSKGTFVDFDHGLNTAIKKIRAALGDNANLPRYVETMPRRGYRFLAPVEKISDEVCATGSSLIVPADTPQPVTPVHSRYRDLLFVLAIGLIALSCAFVYRHWSGKRTGSTGRIVLVILPFENIGGDSGEDYLCEGFSEELTTQLGRADPKRLAVVARVTSAAYVRNKTIADIGRDLHADYVIEGSVRRDQHQVRVTAQLIRVRDQGHVWANEFDRELNSVLALESEVAGAIAQQVQVAIASG
jgi:TolB-like protein/DNA-binding winged helix-turn-helix (wHTH) protein